MTTKDSGGAAFPVANGGYVHESGMNLRDWFAGQALQNPIQCNGVMADRDLDRWFGARGNITRAEVLASQAYDLADAMIAERSK